MSTRLRKHPVRLDGVTRLPLREGAVFVSVRPGPSGPEAWVLEDPEARAARPRYVVPVPFGGDSKYSPGFYVGSSHGHYFLAVPYHTPGVVGEGEEACDVL